MRSAVPFLFLISLVPGELSAQTRVPLGKPDAESREPFTAITSVRELPGGKVLVADATDKVVQLVDLASGSVTRVGREGRGPGEYSLPTSLIPLPNGTTLIQDPLNRRFLVVGADGKPGGFADFPPSPSGGGGPGGGPGIMVGGVNSRADARGRLYFQAPPFSFETGTQLDSIPVLRWDRASPRLDTVAYYRLPAGSASMTRRGGDVNVRIGGGTKVFAPAEAWAVTGDGRVARVIPSPYRVIWYDGPARASAGPVQAYTPIKVGEAEKEREREARRRARPMMIAIGPGGGGGAAPPNPQMPEPEFEETMPPFGQTGVLGTPDGEVWVLRHRPASDKNPSYDVFDRTGALVKKVVLEPNSRVVGFGQGTVYVARSDEDDLQYLQRFRKP